MHFSKTYTELLLTLPPELRANAIEYRQLKKLINKVVNELASLGLHPSVLQELLEPCENVAPGLPDGRERSSLQGPKNSHESIKTFSLPRLIYEVSTSDSIGPRLKLRVKGTQAEAVGLSPSGESYVDPGESVSESSANGGSLGDDVERYTQITSPNILFDNVRTEDAKELIIPLLADTAFFRLLSTALQSLSDHLVIVHSEFMATLQNLSLDISQSARPVSSTSPFHPRSPTSNPASIKPSFFAARAKSDLYLWRELFRLYIEAEVFENISEVHRGERTVEDSETRLQAFLGRVAQRGLAKELKLTQSRAALESFLGLNVFILNVKKFQLANVEATRKILKKHAKRTALPLPAYVLEADSSKITEFALIPEQPTSLPRVLVQAIGETLLPIIPHVDDYACLICTSIAFKPIRLICGHFFCVRCLVKMQKRGKGNCPMCRAPTVLIADRSNVDWALLNFMQDWFPVEAKAKLQNNKQETAEEELKELGVDIPSLRASLRGTFASQILMLLGNF